MTTSNNGDKKLYTYRNGKKVYLKKEENQIVTRALPEDLAKRGIEEGVEQVSSGSSKITVKKEDRDTMMDELRESVVTHHAYSVEDVDNEFLITDRIIITFKEKMSNEKLGEFIAKYALTIVQKYSEKDYLLQLTNQTGMNPVKLVVQLHENEGDVIDYCEHDLNQRMMKFDVPMPVDNKFINQWHLHDALSDPSFDSRSSSNCDGAWNLLNNFGSPDIVIGVTDDGCRLDHLDFDSVDKFAQWGYMQGTSLINRDSISADPQKMYQSGSDHGTACCGVSAADVDASLTVGAAPGCRLLPIKWESNGDYLDIGDSKLLTVLYFIEDKVDILSNSWGNSPFYTVSNQVLNKINQLSVNGGRRGKGIVFLWAAGNENCPINHSGNLDIPFTNGFNPYPNWVGVRTSKVFIHNLASCPGVMHIAALASNAQRSHYSNYGSDISVCAPSSNSHTYWRLPVTGLGVTTSTGQFPMWQSGFGGTSSATPLVAGVAALVISANSNLTALEVISILKSTASKNLYIQKYPQTPPTTLDPDTSWDISPGAPSDNGSFNDIGAAEGTWSPWFGHGRVDALEAVKEAISRNITATNDIFNASSNPNKAIPDMNESGISDKINCTRAGSLQSIKVEVDITHTYIGDLILTLVSPSGTTVTLHNRNGSSANNIQKIFEIGNTSSLQILAGESINGDWSLEIQDMASRDEGTLNTWSIEISIETNTKITIEENPGEDIPDNITGGITRTLSVSQQGTIASITVDIDITHTYIGDLIVELTSPNHSKFLLHNRTGGGSDNLIKNYNTANTPTLTSLLSNQIAGDWSLRVADRAGIDIGKLNHWKVEMILE